MFGAPSQPAGLAVHGASAAHPLAAHLLAVHLLAGGGSGGSPLWYATRATGVIALLLLTITVALGIAGASRLESRNWPRVITAGLHKNLSLLVVVFVVAHVLTTVLDSFVSISITAAVIPFSSGYRTFWLGLGAIAFDLILAIVLTSLLRTRLSFRAWRAVHLLAYASWPVALWHGLGTGTDSKVPWLLGLDAACILLVAGALLWRLQLMRPGVARTVAMAATVAVPLATIVFAAVGPAKSGWAARAGTPVALLNGGVGTTGAATNGAVRSGAGQAATTSTQSGWTSLAGRATVARTGRHGREVITVHARTSGRNARAVTVILRGTRNDSGIELSAGSVRIVPLGGGAAWTGPVTALEGTQVAATLHGPGGASEQARLNLRISGRTVAGQVLVTTGGVR